MSLVNIFYGNSYFRSISDTFCSNLWKIENENVRFFLYNYCVDIQDGKLDEKESKSQLVLLDSLFLNIFPDDFHKDQLNLYRNYGNSVDYSVDNYINQIKTDKFVRDDKPENFIENFVDNRNPTEEEVVLIEQSVYTDIPIEESKKTALGDGFGLKYDGLTFSYGNSLENINKF